MMKYEVEVYYKGGGTGIYPIIAPNAGIAKWLGCEASKKFESNMKIVKVTAKKLFPVKQVTYTADPEKPFGAPFDDADDLYRPPQIRWVPCK
jgi:hypothetical protein